LLLLKDADFAYDVYYGVLTGNVRTSKGIVKEQIKDQLKFCTTRRRFAELGLEQGVGFIPYGGIGYGRENPGQVGQFSGPRGRRQELAHIPIPRVPKPSSPPPKTRIGRAWGCAGSIAERGDRSLLSKVAPR